MPVLNEAQTIFTQDGTKASLVACPAGQSVTIYSNGDTLYYDNASTVSSSSNDGNIATGASSTFTSPQYVITAQGTSTQVFVKANETVVTSDATITDDVTITDDLTVTSNLAVTSTSTFTGAVTTTGGITGGKPYNIATWHPVAATSGTDSACTNGTAYVGSVQVPANCTVTGISYLVGSVGGTDKVVVSLHDATGAVLANSDTAGATVGTAAQVQSVAFTATEAVVGPAQYFVAVTFNGTTAKFRTVPAYTSGGVIGGSETQTFGTPAAFTAPTTFTADEVPVAWLY